MTSTTSSTPSSPYHRALLAAHHARSPQRLPVGHPIRARSLRPRAASLAPLVRASHPTTAHPQGPDSQHCNAGTRRIAAPQPCYSSPPSSKHGQASVSQSKAISTSASSTSASVRRVAHKATSTIIRRLSSLAAYVKYAKLRDFPPFPLREKHLWRYLTDNEIAHPMTQAPQPRPHPAPELAHHRPGPRSGRQRATGAPRPSAHPEPH